MHRSPWARATSAVMLLLYVGVQPAMVCTLQCLFQHHGTPAPVAHHMGHHHDAPEPCHGGQVTSDQTPQTSPLAVAVASVSAGDTPIAPVFARLVVPRPTTWIPAVAPSLDPPPPRG